MKSGRDHPTFRTDLGRRIEASIRKFPSKSAASEAAGVSVEQLNKWVAGKVKVPIDGLFGLAEAGDIDFSWLATGVTPVSAPRNDAFDDNRYVGIPRLNARLAAGGGAWNNDTAEVLDHIPFTREFLGKRLGRTTSNGLIILEARGDSMDPTIADGDLVMIDQHQKDLSDGIFAFVLVDVALIKRIHPTLTGQIEVISDNARYRTEVLSADEADRFQVIGKVVWCGHHFSR